MKYIALALLCACGKSAATADTPLAVDGPTAIDVAKPDAPGTDAPRGPDLSCLGQPATATAPDPLAVTGKLFSVDNYQLASVVGATVVLRARADDSAIAQATTASDGSFAMSVATGGVAVDGYFTTAVDGYRPSRIDPGEPLSGGANEDALLLVASDAELARWYAVPSATYTADARTLVTAAVDCQRTPIAGTTLSLAPTADVTYYDAAAQQWDAALAASTNGFALVPNATASATATVHGSADYPSHAISAPIGTLSIAVIQPYR